MFDEHRALFGPGPWNQKELGPGPIPDPPASAYGLAVLFGVCVVCHVLLLVSAKLEGKAAPCSDLLSSKHSMPLDHTSLASMHALLRELSRFGGILATCWVAEHYPPYPHLNKIYDRDLYWAVTAQLFLVALFTLKRVPKNGSEILGREQTEEWKGWMQFSFLMYHYFHAEDTYNAIRVMITCYVWMTGFGNFSFFYMKRDFGAIRLMQMMWRLNFLVVFLCLMFGNTYIFYYICPLHTCFFLVVYASMRIKSEMNHTQWGVRIKLAVLGALVYLVWDLPFTHLYDVIFSWWMNETGTIGAGMGARWEWYFRSSLDHWSTFLGMIFALNYPAAKHWMSVVESLPRHKCVLVKGAALVPITALLWWWYTSVFSREKPEYNATNAYFGCIPLLGYVFLRNLTPTLRSHYAHSLHELGKVTLETYLLQHHVWLTSNAKTLLCLIPIPEWRACNMLLATGLYFVCSRELYRLTMSLRGMLLPDRSVNECYRNLAGVLAVLCGSWVLGLLVRFAAGNAKEDAAPLVVFLSSWGGLALFFYLIRNTNFKSTHTESDDESPAASVPLLAHDSDHTTTTSALATDSKGGDNKDSGAPAGSFIAGGVTGQTFNTACGVTAGLIFAAYLVLGLYFGERTADASGSSVPTSAAAKPAVASRQPGEMAQPLLGLGTLAVSLVMLFSMDSYFGLPMLALKLFGGGGPEAEVTYDAAYGRLLSQLGFGGTLPSTAPDGPTSAEVGKAEPSAPPPEDGVEK